jgi:D-amino-acid dehydrogenase
MDGGIRAAGTVELGGYGPRKNPALLNLITTSAQEALPGLPQPDSTWLGFRPSLPDGLPVVGLSSSSSRVVYAFGHQHLGVTLGGVTGSVVADLVAGRTSPIDLDPYSPRRF